MPSTAASSNKVRDYRARQRAMGLRAIQMSVPDVRADGFRETARAQAKAVASSTHAADDQAFIDRLSTGA